MKVSHILHLTVALLIALLLSACNHPSAMPDNVTIIPTDPYDIDAELDWNIVFGQSDTNIVNNTSTYQILGYYKDTGFAFDSNDKVTLSINHNPIVMQCYQNQLWHNWNFSSSIALQHGETYDISFKYNGQLKMTTKITVPYPAKAQCPPAYSQQRPAPISWELQNSNQFQIVELKSYDFGIDGGDGCIDTFYEKIDPDIREYAFPGNCVSPTNSPMGQTDYVMTVKQMSCKIVNRIGITVQQQSGKGYTLFNEGCIPINPENVANTCPCTDWVLAFMQSEERNSKAPATVIAKYLNTAQPLALSDTISINLGNQHIRLTATDTNSFSGTVKLNPGETPVLSLLVNDNTVTTANIQLPYEPTVIYPTSYNPLMTFCLNWTLNNDNQYQFIEVTSHKANDTPEGLNSEYLVEVGKDLRSLWIVNGVVEDFGLGTSYSISLKEVNIQYLLSDVVVMVLNDNIKSYNTLYTKSIHQKTEEVNRILKQVKLL